MESLPNPTIQHFTHPGHPLVLKEFNPATEYLCDCCKTPGAGKRYRCDGCDFDMHEHCSVCPGRLLTFMHHHELRLLMRKAKPDCLNILRTCNVCSESVEGLFYCCNVCEFVVHPLCTLLPESNVRHVLHRPDHPLKLESSSVEGICAFCKEKCSSSSWRYRCSPCGFDIHIGCILEDCRQQQHQECARGIIPKSEPPPQYHHPLPSQYHHPPPLQYHHPPPPQYSPPQYGVPPPPYYGGYYQPFQPPTHYGGYYNQSSPPPPSYVGYHNPFPPPPSYGGIHYSQSTPFQSNQVVVGTSSSGTGRPRKMFALVAKLTLGVMSSAMFGMDVTSFFFP